MSDDTNKSALLITSAEAAKLATACRTIASIFRTASEYVPVSKDRSVPSAMTARYPPCERGVPTKVLPKPKKPPSAETLYNQRHRTKLKISFPDKDSKDIAAMLADQWAKASDEERESFFGKERALQAQYNNKLAIYEAKLGEYMESAPVNEFTSFANESTSPVDEGRGYDKDSETGGDGGIDSISKATKSKKKKKRKSSYDDVGLDLGLELDGSLKKRKKKKTKSKDR